MNNAGVNRPGLLEQATVVDMDYALALNVRAAMILVQAFVPGMRAAKFGRIVSISSRAILGKTSRTVYSAAKAGLVGMTRTWCLDLLSPTSGYITGQTLFVCGGTSISGTGGE